MCYVRAVIAIAAATPPCTAATRVTVAAGRSAAMCDSSSRLKKTRMLMGAWPGGTRRARSAGVGGVAVREHVCEYK